MGVTLTERRIRATKPEDYAMSIHLTETLGIMATTAFALADQLQHVLEVPIKAVKPARDKPVRDI